MHQLLSKNNETTFITGVKINGEGVVLKTKEDQE